MGGVCSFSHIHSFIKLAQLASEKTDVKDVYEQISGDVAHKLYKVSKDLQRFQRKVRKRMCSSMHHDTCGPSHQYSLPPLQASHSSPL